MQERELVKIKSDNPSHPKGYYIQFRDRVKPEDVEYSDDTQAPEPTNKKKVKR